MPVNNKMKIGVFFRWMALLAAMMTSAPLTASTVPPQKLVDEALAHLNTGEIELAIQKLEAARMMRPSDIRVLYQLGLAYYNQGMEATRIDDIDRAQHLWRQALEMIPTDADSMLRNTLADIVARADTRREEIYNKLQLEQSLTQNPTSLEEGLKYARMLLKKRRNSDAAKIYQNLMEAHDADPRAFTEMGGLVYSMGRILWAERYYDQALQRDPSYQPAVKAMSALYDSLEALRLEGYESLVESSH